MVKINPHAKHVREIRGLCSFSAVDIDAHAIYAGRSEAKRGPVQSTRIIKRATGRSAKLADIRKESGIVTKADTSAPRTFHGGR